ncbi:TIGD1: Tigger transposable element-derived protein 1 [Crotalus adamanteus]|uniref:TIGD1: Tigger transposable element-derived protein 1 n=1 Tax=Crotalus adamanteus TaxID=8729 RepID=A0AAW1BVA2_CROAD
MDPDVERFRRVHWEMCEILKCYREIYEGKKKEKNDKENKQNGLLKKATPSPAPLPFLLPFQSTGIQNPDPQPSTSYASGSDVPENTENYEYFQGFISNLMLTEYEGCGTTHKKTFQVGRSEEVDLGRFH